jgi:uncharacterized membrane protein
LAKTPAVDDFALARAVHVIAVLFWIGGVGFVTRVLMPTLKATELPQDRLRRFQQMEARFAWQARLWVCLPAQAACGWWRAPICGAASSTPGSGGCT